MNGNEKRKTKCCISFMYLKMLLISFVYGVLHYLITNKQKIVNFGQTITFTDLFIYIYFFFLFTKKKLTVEMPLIQIGCKNKKRSL